MKNIPHARSTLHGMYIPADLVSSGLSMTRNVLSDPMQRSTVGTLKFWDCCDCCERSTIFVSLSSSSTMPFESDTYCLSSTLTFVSISVSGLLELALLNVTLKGQLFCVLDIYFAWKCWDQPLVCNGYVILPLLIVLRF
eukprot:636157_1